MRGTTRRHGERPGRLLAQALQDGLAVGSPLVLCAAGPTPAVSAPRPVARGGVQRLARYGLVAWLVGMLALGATLAARHLIALPVADVHDARLAVGVARLWDHPAAPGTWRAVHVLSRACRCSQRTLAYLVAGPRPAHLEERVLLIDPDREPAPELAELVAAGMPARVMSPDELTAQLGLEAAPVLVLIAPAGEVAYVGGYTRRKQSGLYEDREILAALQAQPGRTTAGLPVFGCPTSERLARLLDPLGVTRP